MKWFRNRQPLRWVCSVLALYCYAIADKFYHHAIFQGRKGEIPLLPFFGEGNKLIPEQMEERECFAVRRSDIDTNEHVNNCRYVQMAQEVLEEEIEVKHLRVEYKNSARYGDKIVPKIGRDGERTVVELCSEEDKPYAIVEFRI